jgi:hypothetical protein
MPVQASEPVGNNEGQSREILIKISVPPQLLIDCWILQIAESKIKGNRMFYQIKQISMRVVTDGLNSFSALSKLHS